MKSATTAALALIISVSASAQAPAPPAASTEVPSTRTDYSIATPLGGNWSYVRTADGSEATFLDSANRVQLGIHCTRTARTVTVFKPASAAAPFLNVWTSGQQRMAPSAFNPATGRLSATIKAWDGLLDAMVFSRGRIAVGVSGGVAVVVPSWAEISRVVEDCRT